MNDTNPSPNQTPEGDITAELHELGKNLRDTLRAAWASEERQNLQKEIENGLTELTATLSQAVHDFSESSTGQTLKADVNDFKERLRSGEVENRLRAEILGALRKVNTELQKTAQKDRSPQS